jgi:heme/copper-type cytochrome/quinol oxidase subunit 2
MDILILLLLLLTTICVVVFLVTGLVSMAHTDPKVHEKSNLLMRLRVISQGVAIVLPALLVYFSR